MNREQMTELRAALAARREELMQAANRELAFIDGKMAMIDEMLAEMTEEQSPNGEVHEAVEVEAAN